MPHYASEADLDRIHEELLRIERKVDIIMSMVEIDQSVLDGIASQLLSFETQIQTLVNDQGNNLSQADVSGITTTLSDISNLLSGASTPAPTGTTSDSPTSPADPTGGTGAAPAS